MSLPTALDGTTKGLLAVKTDGSSPEAAIRCLGMGHPVAGGSGTRLVYFGLRRVESGVFW